MDDLTGLMIANRIRLDVLLKGGEHGAAYKAWDLKRQAFLTVKVLQTSLIKDEEVQRRLWRKTQALERLRHPFLANFYGVEEQDGLVFVLRDYIEGVTLAAALADARAADLGPFTPEQILFYLRPLCSALHFAHLQGLAHGDLRPANIFVDPSQKVLLADLGITRMLENAARPFGAHNVATNAQNVATNAQNVASDAQNVASDAQDESSGAQSEPLGAQGSPWTLIDGEPDDPDYMAPEQEPGQEPVPQVDIYALGLMLYEMLTGGRRAFSGDNAWIEGSRAEKARWERRRMRAPSPARVNEDISAGIDAVVLRCLEKDPARRFSTTLDLANAFLQAATPPAEADQPTIRASAAVERAKILPPPPMVVQAEEGAIAAPPGSPESPLQWVEAVEPAPTPIEPPAVPESPAAVEMDEQRTVPAVHPVAVEAVQPAAVQPEVIQPEVVQPAAVQPEAVQPDTPQPEVVQPEALQPAVVEPDELQHEVIQPDIPQPEAIQPAAPGVEIPAVAEPAPPAPAHEKRHTAPASMVRMVLPAWQKAASEPFKPLAADPAPAPGVGEPPAPAPETTFPTPVEETAVLQPGLQLGEEPPVAAAALPEEQPASAADLAPAADGYQPIPAHLQGPSERWQDRARLEPLEHPVAMGGVSAAPAPLEQLLPVDQAAGGAPEAQAELVAPPDPGPAAVVPPADLPSAPAASKPWIPPFDLPLDGTSPSQPLPGPVFGEALPPPLFSLSGPGSSAALPLSAAPDNLPPPPDYPPVAPGSSPLPSGNPPMARRIQKSGGLNGWIYLVLGVLAMVILISGALLLIFARLGKPDQPAPTTSPAPTFLAVSVATVEATLTQAPLPTETPFPTWTPIPTATRAPTRTQLPTETLAVTATPTPQPGATQTATLAQGGTIKVIFDNQTGETWIPYLGDSQLTTRPQKQYIPPHTEWFEFEIQPNTYWVKFCKLSDRSSCTDLTTMSFRKNLMTVHIKYYYDPGQKVNIYCDGDACNAP
jgi:serine/threonine protein kinase